MRTDSRIEFINRTLSGILTCFVVVDKTNANKDDDENSVYETIEFSDSSSNVYTEPIGDYGVLRKVNIKTSPRQQPTNKKPPSGMKKSTESRNLQKFKAMTDVSLTEDVESNPNVELRVKPYETTDVVTRDTSKASKSLISVGLHDMKQKKSNTI